MQQGQCRLILNPLFLSVGGNGEEVRTVNLVEAVELTMELAQDLGD